MSWQDIVKQDGDEFNRVLKEFKETQKKAEMIHYEINMLIHELVSKYSEVNGGFLPKPLMVDGLHIADKYDSMIEEVDNELSKFIEEVAEKMQAKTDVDRGTFP